jgi:glycerate 2-kinase
MIIRNLRELAQQGNIDGRRMVLEVIEAALERVNSYRLIKEQVKINGNLCIGSRRYQLDKIRNIFVVGGGKQITFVASALEDILQDRITEGVVVEKKGWGRKTKRIKVVEGGHPLPDNGSLEGAEEIIRIAKNASKEDLVLVCVAGGCTSLTMLPPAGITLEDARKVSSLMLNSGAPIQDVNTVRTHLSQVSGGKLSMLAHPAQIASLIAMDEVPGIPWGPSVPDRTSFPDAKRVLIRYGLWDKVPASVREYFEAANVREETPKSTDFERIGIREYHLIFAHNGLLCEAAERKARELGLRAMTLSTSIEGEAKDVGVVFASIAREIEKNNRPMNPPCIVIASGETTVTIQTKQGEGGRNQELALAAALKIQDSEKITIASIGTDGTDGPTDIAGAIVDGYTMKDAETARVDLAQCLRLHDSSRAFRNLHQAIYTTNTGTNLMDLIITYVS